VIVDLFWKDSGARDAEALGCFGDRVFFPLHALALQHPQGAHAQWLIASAKSLAGNIRRSVESKSPLRSVGEIQAPNLSNGTIVAMRLQESHYLGAENVVIDH
jgi:hypothetical protein